MHALVVGYDCYGRLRIALLVGDTALQAHYLHVQGEARISGMLHNMFFSFCGNLAGALTVMELVHATNIFTKGLPATDYVCNFSHTKAYIGWGQAYIRGFLCNWLVCLAVWQSVAALDVASLIASVFFPVMAFVVTGYDHLVANMFIIPFGMRLGSAVTIRRYVLHRLIPTFLGNFSSSVIMVAFTYSMCYGSLPVTIKAGLSRWHQRLRPVAHKNMQTASNSTEHRSMCVDDGVDAS